ncbi:MAG: hypothetical protein JXB32_16345 [Deltaproteobacteria bacterium]|nr:hypothetical protein [Deltaproteobacteria bacterium]
MRRGLRPGARRLVLAAALAGAGLCLAACRQTTPPGKRDAAGSPGAPMTVVDARAWLQDDTLPEGLDPLPGHATEPPLVVLERGVGARALRLEPEVGTRQVLAVRVEQAVDEAVDGVAERVDFTVRLRVELTVEERTTDGGLRGTLRIGGTTLEREPSEAERIPVLRKAVAELAGVAARVQLGPFGDLMQAEWELPAGWSAEVRDAARMVTGTLELVASALPAEPVGAGGRWGREFRSGPDSGLDATTRERFLLEALDGARGRLRGRTRTRAGEQELQAPPDAADVQVRLLELDLRDSTELLFDLGRPLPLQGRRALSSIQRRRQTVDGRTELRETRTRTLLELEPAGDD